MRLRRILSLVCLFVFFLELMDPSTSFVRAPIDSGNSAVTTSAQVMPAVQAPVCSRVVRPSRDLTPALATCRLEIVARVVEPSRVREPRTPPFFPPSTRIPPKNCPDEDSLT